MKKFRVNKDQQFGFTIIELVIVILVIGILSAVALPRMIDLTTQARKSTASAIKGYLSTSVELLRSQWIAENKPETVTNFDNQIFFIGNKVSPNGPYDTGAVRAVGANNITAAFADTDCLALWNKLLRNPPDASVTVDCAKNRTCIFEVSLAAGLCTYTDRDTNVITYDRLTGEVL